MARIRWSGGAYTGTITEDLADGGALVTMKEHGPRFAVGTVIRVTKDEIISRDDNDAPDPAKSMAALESAMIAERETLQPVAELLEAAKAEPEPSKDSP